MNVVAHLSVQQSFQQQNSRPCLICIGIHLVMPSQLLSVVMFSKCLYTQISNKAQEGRKLAFSTLLSKTCIPHVLHKDFNLKFKQPAKDTRSRCDTFDVQLAALHQQKGDDIADRIKQLETEQEEYHCAAQLARDSLVADRHEAKDTSKSVSVITFDLQSALPTPSLTSE